MIIVQLDGKQYAAVHQGTWSAFGMAGGSFYPIERGGPTWKRVCALALQVVLKQYHRPDE